jgi:RimJ/RimL family protein N-acetyltransferase
MNTIQSALIRLEENRINNISIINFIKNNRILSIDLIGNSVLARGISDRRWVYISCPDKTELNLLKTHLKSDDNNFAAINGWMVPVLTQGKEIVWDLSAVQYYLPDNVQLSLPLEKAVPLTEKDVQTVFINSEYREYISPEYVLQRIEKGMSAGIYEDNKLVSWAMTQDDGAIGFLHTLDDYRQRGYGLSVTLSIIERQKKLGELSFAYVLESNKRSIGLLQKLGFKKNKIVHWFEIE